ncbi:MAG: phosphoglycerate kinase [Actinomycetota bacterium]|nr:phosphoglycerate kinase [Actinomycetota bacterium]
MRALPSIADLDVAGKRLLVRCDLNVPLADGRITDDLRIRASLPTLEALLDTGARLAVCSHLGRPKGKFVEELRLAPVGERLGELLRRDVVVSEDVAGPGSQKACSSEAEVVLLENLRFEPGEEKNDPRLANDLADLAEAYVNDAFGASHRAHASIVGVAEKLPSAAGLLLHEEVAQLERLLQEPERPFVAVLGGAKVSDKLGVIDNLLDRCDSLCIGGAMAFTLLAAQGKEVGRSLVERDRVDEVKGVLEQAERKGVSIILPSDVVAADSPDEGAAHANTPLESIGDRMGVDIGSESRVRFAQTIRRARSVLWNGPMGIFEIDAYAGGTKAVAEAMAQATKDGAFTVAGGGDSAAALAALDMTDAVSHLSTGGGASLELLEGRELPGVAVLRKESQ